MLTGKRVLAEAIRRRSRRAARVAERITRSLSPARLNRTHVVRWAPGDGKPFELRVRLRAVLWHLVEEELPHRGSSMAHLADGPERPDGRRVYRLARSRGSCRESWLVGACDPRLSVRTGFVDPADEYDPLPGRLRPVGVHSWRSIRTRRPRNETPSSRRRRRCSSPSSPGSAIRPPAATTRCQGSAFPLRRAHTVMRAPPGAPPASATSP